MATSEGQLPAQRPAQVVMVSVRNGGSTQDQHHVRTQRPTQPGSGLTGRYNSPGMPRGRTLSPGTAAARRSKSADQLKAAARSRSVPPCSPEASHPRKSRAVTASPGGTGISNMALAITEGSSLMISLRSEVGGDCSGTSGTEMTRPLGA